MPHLDADPRKWQTTALMLWQEQCRGIVAAVTGAGKSTFALYCIDYFRSRFPDGVVLVEVPTSALLDQWFVNLVEDYHVEPSDIALLGGGRKKWEGKPFVISVINTARDLASKIAAAGPTMLIVDECHRAGSQKNASALCGDFLATLGLSATPERQYDAGLEELVIPKLGEVLYRYDYAAAYADGVIVPFSLSNVKFALKPAEQREYDRLTKRIAQLSHLCESYEAADERLENLLRARARVSWNSPLRVPLAAKLALSHRKERLIIFHESTERADEICALLVQRGVRATSYHTKISAVRRRDNLRRFKSGHFSCLVCCRALDEGLNVPETTVGIVASSTSSVRQRIQRLGRVLRRLPGKPCALIYTLFATKVEYERLQREESALSGISEVSWLEANVNGG